MKWLAGFVVGVLTLGVLERLASQGAPGSVIAAMGVGMVTVAVSGIWFLIDLVRNVTGGAS